MPDHSRRFGEQHNEAASELHIKSGNTCMPAGVLVVNKKPRVFTIQVDDEVYPIVVNNGGKSTKFVSRNHI